MVRFLINIKLYLYIQYQKMCSSRVYCIGLVEYMCSGNGSADDFAKPLRSRSRLFRFRLVVNLSFALSLSKGRPFMVRQAHHERTTQVTLENKEHRVQDARLVVLSRGWGVNWMRAGHDTTMQCGKEVAKSPAFES